MATRRAHVAPGRSGRPGGLRADQGRSPLSGRTKPFRQAEASMMDHREHVTRAHAISAGEPPRRYVAYYRVSTGQQEKFGLSIESQRAMVRDYVASNSGVVIAEFSEV